MVPPVIQGLWIGSELSAMEQLSIQSFLHHGHPYHLYVYEAVRHVPAGTVVKDANAILPASMIFQYTREKSYAGFSNFFRYKLLFERGGWWADLDMVCLKPWAFEAPYVFSSEPLDGHGPEVATSSAIKAPAGSEVMAYAWRVCQSQDPAALRWEQTGPQLIKEAIHAVHLESYLQSAVVFCPVHYLAWERVLDADVSWTFGQATHAVHLWNEMWRRTGRDKNRRYHPNCLYEQLKCRYRGEEVNRAVLPH